MRKYAGVKSMLGIDGKCPCKRHSWKGDNRCGRLSEAHVIWMKIQNFLLQKEAGRLREPDFYRRGVLMLPYCLQDKHEVRLFMFWHAYSNIPS